MTEQCCALYGVTRCIRDTCNGWHLCRAHLDARPKYAVNIVEEIADQSPIEQSARAHITRTVERRVYRRIIRAHNAR